MFDSYDNSLCGGVPAVWPRAPRWPTDSALLGKIRLSLAPENQMTASEYLMEPVKKQRLMDLAWAHFNRLIDKYNAEGARHTLEEWAELVCVPTGWGTDQMMDWLGSRENLLEEETNLYDGEQFGSLYGKNFMELAPNAHSISRRSVQRKCDKCRTPTLGECALCGEAFCSRACMLAVKGHRRECEMVYENGNNCGAIVTLVEMMDVLTPEEFEAATGGHFTPQQAGGGFLGVDRRKEKEAGTNAGDWARVCAARGCVVTECAKKCTTCRAVYYCGKECQKKDWKTHKKVCASMAMGTMGKHATESSKSSAK